MKKTQIFRGAAALMLIAVGAFAGRASKFAAVTNLYYSISGACQSTPILLGSAASTLLTTGSSLGQATMKTVGGTEMNLYSVSGCGSTHRVHFKG